MSRSSKSFSNQRSGLTYKTIEQLGSKQLEGRVQSRYTTGDAQAWLEHISGITAGDNAHLIYRMRNRIYRVPDPLNPDEQLCIKAFKSPGRLRSIWYRWKGSKAARAHQYAEHLYRHVTNAEPANVTEPIGYLERYERQQLVESYLISRLLPQASDLYTEMNFLLNRRPVAADFVQLMRVVAEACRHMHDSGFQHNDLGPQNIMLRRHIAERGIQWSDVIFIDLNRGVLRPELSLKHRAEDLARLRIPSHFMGIFLQIYFGDRAVPDEFARHERRCRRRIMRHERSRKWRHPIRTLRGALSPATKPKHLKISSGKPSERDAWLWDSYSGQPSVVLKGRDRKQFRKISDMRATITSNLRHSWRIYRHYRTRKAQAYQHPIDMAERLGVCIEVDAQIDRQLALLQQTPGIPVLVRVYFHQPEQQDTTFNAIQRLHEQGHPVAVGLIQSRRAVLEHERWDEFVNTVVEQTHAHVQLYEVGHAVNRAKWGFWTLDDMTCIWRGIETLRQRYPRHQFLGPAVNDFEFHYYPPLLDRMGQDADALSCHLYVDRRGAPENYQGRFSTLEKCLYGRALADAWGTKGFHVTEINWPLQNTGLYSPIAGAYVRQDSVESDLHVDEQTSAAYMIRFALIAACSGAVETTYWWRLAHHGFGLVDDRDGWRERPGWLAMVQFHRHLSDKTFLRREEKNGAIWWYFESENQTIILAYALEPTRVPLYDGIQRVEDQYGEPVQTDNRQITLDGQVSYLLP